MTAPVADMAATWIDSHAADRIWSSESRRSYQRRVGDVSAFQTVTLRESLNEKTIIERMGT
jgi:hypothetical protein